VLVILNFFGIQWVEIVIFTKTQKIAIEDQRSPMVYLTCSKHRSFQRKHIDVCRKCADRDDCKAFLEYSAQEPPALQETPSSEHRQAPPPPISGLFETLMEIRSLAADSEEKHRSKEIMPRVPSSKSKKLVSIVKTELKEIRKLC